MIRETAVCLVAMRETLPDLRHELIFVDAAAATRRWRSCHELLRQNGRIGMVTLARTVGHQIAVTADLEHAGGDAMSEAANDTFLIDIHAELDAIIDKRPRVVLIREKPEYSVRVEERRARLARDYVVDARVEDTVVYSRNDRSESSIQ